MVRCVNQVNITYENDYVLREAPMPTANDFQTHIVIHP